jgi:chemotaxis protein methyltransferase CheR
MAEARLQSPVALESVEPLTAAEFQEIRQLAYDKFGLDLRQGKEELVSARLGRKIREANCRSFREYYRHVLEDGTGEALIGMIDALATNHTGFLREPAHFDFLREKILPSLVSRGAIDIWSAACSTGEEPYTIAFTAMETMLPADYAKLRILATDISTKALDSARRAVYPAERFAEFPPLWMRRFLLRGQGQWKGWYRIKPEVSGRVQFARLNLVEPFSHNRRFPLIFCRNVMIYFDKPTQERLVNRLAEHLEPGGYLFVGHAESLTGVDHPLQYVRPAIYRNPDHRAAQTGGGPWDSGRRGNRRLPAQQVA